MGWRRSILRLGGACVLLLLAACARERAPDGPAARAVGTDSLSWNAVPGAQRYVVRAWSGGQLLFEVSTPETLLVLTPSLARAVAAFDTSTAEIVPEGAAAGRAPVRIPLRPRGHAASGAGGGT